MAPPLALHGVPGRVLVPLSEPPENGPQGTWGTPGGPPGTPGNRTKRYVEVNIGEMFYDCLGLSLDVLGLARELSKELSKDLSEDLPRT